MTRDTRVPLSIGVARVELRWFFTEGDGALGLKGIDYNRGGGRPQGVEAARSYESAVARWSEVSRRLDAVNVAQRRTLRAAFVPKPWPRVFQGWYDIAGVAAQMVDRTNDLEAARRIMLLGAEDALVLRRLANAELEDALHAFVGDAPRERVLPLPAMPKVPRIKVPLEEARTWVPMEGDRLGWLSAEEGMRPCAEQGGGRCRVLPCEAFPEASP